jgi:hypothetical protein
LLVEPQPWKCYKNADKRCRKLGLDKPLHLEDIAIKSIDDEIVAYVKTLPGVIGKCVCISLLSIYFLFYFVCLRSDYMALLNNRLAIAGQSIRNR